MRNRVEKLVSAPREVVFDYLAEPLNQPDWMEEVSSVDLSEDEPVEVGDTNIEQEYTNLEQSGEAGYAEQGGGSGGTQEYNYSRGGQ